MLATNRAFQIGSRNVLAKRKYSRFWTGSLPEEVVDAIDRVLGKRLVQRGVEGPRGRQVAAKRLLDDQPRTRRRSRPREIRRHRAEQAGRNGQVEHRPSPPARAPRAAGRRWPDPSSRPTRSETRAARRAYASASTPPCAARLSFMRAHSRSVVQSGLATPITGTFRRPWRTIALQRGEDLLVGEIAGGAEQHEGVGVSVRHGAARCDRRRYAPAGRSTWPPN